MKKNIMFAILMALGLIGCTRIDYKDYKPIYYVVNQSDEVVDIVYTLQPSIAEQGFKQIDTIEINVCDTAEIALLGQLNMEKTCKPAAMFSNLKFISKSGKVLKETNSINNKEWSSINISNGEYADIWAYGWLYEFKKE